MKIYRHQEMLVGAALLSLAAGTSLASCSNPEPPPLSSNAGTGGSSVVDSGVPDSSTGGTVAATGGTTGSGGGGGAGGIGPVTCSLTPNANAGDVTLTFAEMMLPAEISTALGGKNEDDNGWGGDGFTVIGFIPGSPNEALLLQNRGRVNHVSIPDGMVCDDGTTDCTQDANACSGIGSGACAMDTDVTLINTFDIGPVHYVKDCGLISMEFDPDFETNGLVYFGYCDTQNSSKVARYTFTGSELTDAQDIVTWTRATTTDEWHTVGSIGFDDNDNLWVLHGDFNTDNVADNLDSSLGKLLRVVPNRMPGQGGYEPAEGNPFFSDPEPRNAIWAYGLRSPWRGMTNRHGHIVFADVGGDNEEVNIVTEGGQFYGWADGTGNCESPCVSPIAWYRSCTSSEPGCNDEQYRADGDPIWGARSGRAVWVGPEYADCGNDRYGGALTGVMLFGDFMVGYVRGMLLDETGTIVAGSDKSLGNMTTITSWGQGADGYLYATTYGGPYDSVSADDKNALWRALPVQN